eukprot:m.441317 g.441317  ORF g.441317 m.441317 type:complete len:171 (-) comp18647_c0_seq1:240-752(-)
MCTPALMPCLAGRARTRVFGSVASSTRESGSAWPATWCDAAATPMTAISNSLDSMHLWSHDGSSSAANTTTTRKALAFASVQQRRTPTPGSGAVVDDAATPVPAWEEGRDECTTPTGGDCVTVSGWAVSTRASLVTTPVRQTAASNQPLPSITMSRLYKRRAGRKFNQAN